MGKIVKLKNKKTGVRVYPVTATSAVVDANSGERLNDTLQNKVEEAPMDGAQYVRKNGTWAIAEVSMDSNEICRINLKSNQGDADNSSLNGATVNVVNTVTGDVLYDGVWDGTEIQLSIPGATIYKVTVGDVADYKTPEAITIEATAFSSRDLIMTYQTELVIVQLSTFDNVMLSGQSVTINEKQLVTDNAGTCQTKVKYGTNYSVTPSEKFGYKTPDSQSFTAGNPNRNVLFNYTTGYETLTISVSGISSGFNIVIRDNNGNQLSTQNTITGTHKILEGTIYTISSSAVDGYFNSEEQTFEAVAGNGRSVSVVYIVDGGVSSPSTGVYLKATNGKYYTAETWNDLVTPSCIALIGYGKNVGVSLDAISIASFCNASDATKVPSLSVLSESDAIVDYNGLQNTSALISAYGSVDALAKIQSYTFPDGKTGYIPALGELKMFIDNKAAIDVLITKAGHTALSYHQDIFSSSRGSNLTMDDGSSEIRLWSHRQNVGYLESNVYKGSGVASVYIYPYCSL